MQEAETSECEIGAPICLLCSPSFHASPGQALEEDSDADYVALPTSDVPAMGSWVTQTAWKVPARTVE